MKKTGGRKSRDTLPLKEVCHKNLTPRCAAHRGVKILVLAIQKDFLQILSYMLE